MVGLSDAPLTFLRCAKLTTQISFRKTQSKSDPHPMAVTALYSNCRATRINRINKCVSGDSNGLWVLSTGARIRHQTSEVRRKTLPKQQLCNNRFCYRLQFPLQQSNESPPACQKAPVECISTSGIVKRETGTWLNRVWPPDTILRVRQANSRWASTCDAKRGC